MAQNPKTLENMSKHLTNEELELREAAEAITLPHRDLDPEKPPKSLAGDSVARKYWRNILGKMVGYSILDELDAETFAIYCSMASRRDAMNRLCVKLISEASGSKLSTDERLELMEKVDGLSAKLQTHEKTLLSYAKELGLTPSGRVHLARRRAVAAASGDEPPTDEMFGD